MDGWISETIRVPEAAARLGVCLRTFYSYVHRDEIPVIRFGQRIYVLREPFERMLSGQDDGRGQQHAGAA